MAKAPSKRSFKTALAVLGASVVIGGSFIMASGEVVFAPDSLFAAVFNSLSSRPMVVFSKSANSPKEALKSGKVVSLAVFDVGVKNVSFWATARQIKLDIAVTGNSANSLQLSDFTVTYRYCMPAGRTYGYGYKGGSCGGKQLAVAISREGNTYKLATAGDLVIYPGASVSQLTVTAKPKYSVGGNANAQASLRVSVSGVVARGDQCSAYSQTLYPQTFGYSGCVPVQVSANSASANVLQVQRSYGYGYCLI